jgi:formylmethanofuran dehydrogenase subunit E
MSKSIPTQLNITKKEKWQEMYDVMQLQEYILTLKEKELGSIRCEKCGATKGRLEIHHKRYGKDINYYDLELLCKKCHTAIHWGPIV